MNGDPSGSPLSLHKVPSDRADSAAAEPGGKFVPLSEPLPFIRDGEVRGLCNCYSEREDVTKEVLEGNLQLCDVDERYDMGEGWGSNTND